MKVLITGGTGYIGEFFVPQLLKEGHQVRLLVRNLEKGKKLFGNFCEYFVGDVTVKESLKGCCEGIDIVFHMVAKVGNELPSEKNFKAFRNVNVEGTRNLIDECKKANIKKFIFVSSIAAMGIVKETPCNENSECTPYLPYQVSKYEAEKLVNEEYCKNGFPGICIRPTKVYGVGEHEYSYLILAKLCKIGYFPKVGKKKNYTSNIYITDLIQALVKLIDKGRIGETYILSASDSIGFVESGKIIANILNKKIKVISIPANLMIGLAGIEEKFYLRMGRKPIVTKKNVEATITDRIYDISKAKKELGYCPQVRMEDGIERVISWYLDSGLI